MFSYVLILTMTLQLFACKANYEESKTSHSSDSVEDERRKLLEKIIQDYLQRLQEARIEQVIDPYYDQGELAVRAKTAQLFGHDSFSQVSWNRVQADKLEVLRCAINKESNKSCPDASKMAFETLEKNPAACGYQECKRVREKIYDGTKLIDRSIVASPSAMSYQYLVRPCFENYLLLGKGASETLVKCGTAAIKNSNTSSTSARYLAQRACGESALLICGKKSYLSSAYIKGKGIKYIDTKLFDDREAVIKKLEELAMEMAREAQKGLKESLLATEMPYEQRMREAKEILEEQNMELAEAKVACINEQDKKAEDQAKKEWFEQPVFWQALAAAPFGAISTAPDCYQHEELAEEYYVNTTIQQRGEEHVSDAGKQAAREQGYIDCAKDNITTLLQYRKQQKNLMAQGENLSSYDVNAILDTGIAMIPMAKSELNSQSTSDAVFTAIGHLTSASEDEIACECPKCLPHALMLRTYERKKQKLGMELDIINDRINAELSRKGIEDPYANDQ